MKKFLAFILALCMVLSLAACGDTEKDTPVNAPANEPEVIEPEVTEPEATEPEVTEPEVTEPEVTEPEVTEPEVVKEFVEPEVEEIVTDGEISLEKISMKDVTVTGSTPWQNCAEDCTKAVDGDISTYFDGVENGWMEIDFGGKVKFDVIGFAPRSTFQGRMVDGMFYVSDDGLDWTVVYTIETNPAYKINYAYLDQMYEARYIRYDVPSINDGNHLANIAELGVYRTVSEVSDEAVDENVDEAADETVDGAAE